MSQLNPPLHKLSDRWKYAIFGGLASIPFTATGYLETGSELSLSPVLFGGLLAGYLARRKTGESSGVGLRAGLVGGLPVFWLLADILMATSGLAGPLWFVATGIIFSLGFAVVVATLGFGLSAVIGEVGAKIGSRIAGFNGRHRPPTTGI